MLSKASKPEWLIKKYDAAAVLEMESLLRIFSLRTVCEEAHCPNKCECFANKTAAFMIMGSVCTRNCAFCKVASGKPTGIDADEPWAVAKAAKMLGLVHTVVTSVTRDDLPDGGAAHFAHTITALKDALKGSTVEVLIPDFLGRPVALETVIGARPDVIAHNIETVPSLYGTVRKEAVYQRSLELLRRVKTAGIVSKTGIMVGLGETRQQICTLIEDLAKVGCDILTIGQYLQPSKKHIPAAEYVLPEIFEEYRHIALQKGLSYVESAPLVRSSYNAAKGLKAIRQCR